MSARRFHARLERGVLPVVVHVSEEHAQWYTDERHASLTALLPEIAGDLLAEHKDEAARKKGGSDAVRVKEDVFRGASMELRCFFRKTETLYHVLVPGVQGAELQSADTAYAHTLHITASPKP